MKTIAKLGVLPIAAFATVATGTLINTSAAQAATLSGSISFSGASGFIQDGDDYTVTFDEEVVSEASGDFAGLDGWGYNPDDPSASDFLEFSDLILNNTGVGTYENEASDPFINFGIVNLGSLGSGNLSFALDAGTEFSGGHFGGLGSIFASLNEPISGTWTFNDETFAKGFLSASESGDSSSFSVSLVTVPEPATMLGLGLVAGAGFLASRRKQEVEA